MSAKPCVNFTPHAFKKNTCIECFLPRDDHFGYRPPVGPKEIEATASVKDKSSFFLKQIENSKLSASSAAVKPSPVSVVKARAAPKKLNNDLFQRFSVVNEPAPTSLSKGSSVHSVSSTSSVRSIRGSLEKDNFIHNDQRKSSIGMQHAIVHDAPKEALPVANPYEGKVAKALHNYTASDDTEASFTEGTVFTDIKPDANEGWLQVNVNGSMKLIPENHLDIIDKSLHTEEDDQSLHTKSDKDSIATSIAPELMAKPTAPLTVIKKMKAIHSYTASESDELTIEEGDVIDYISDGDEGWFVGSLKGKQGLCPLSYVEEIKDHIEPTVLKTAKALFDFNAQQQDELSFAENDLLEILNMSSDDWALARLQSTKKDGLVPINYLSFE